MANKCSPNDYFDSLLETCNHCFLRCFKAPPPACREYCSKPDPEKSELEAVVNQPGQGVWTLIWVAVFLVAMVFSITLLRLVLQKKKSGQDFYNKTEADKQKWTAVGSEGDNLFRVAMETGPNEATPHNGDITTLYPPCLPVPATEEGATILVTTKTAHFCSCALDSTGCVELPFLQPEWAT
ncbi:tumor necrosis factor receptor superfamily member 17-like isoform X1 [Acipenser oxyrinchus oxyrinchus]|uniref:Tumor necrosis factor receptor superfamily member 17-like isoform X1 n=1 Tax=Acipenser oxyrinchus oxyrinchus TaxID=40147 RepID=A0AAD8D611_ACIOX|nr:tumor necrosis factor receptor superfamily member 17-like isoform X1 [Acipenser oxyrinchus oxyrinchus]